MVGCLKLSLLQSCRPVHGPVRVLSRVPLQRAPPRTGLAGIPPSSSRSLAIQRTAGADPRAVLQPEGLSQRERSVRHPFAGRIGPLAGGRFPCLPGKPVAVSAPGASQPDHRSGEQIASSLRASLCPGWSARKDRLARIGTSGASLSDERSEFHAVVGGDHLRRLFPDHDRRRIGVAAGHVGHDARVRHAQLATPSTRSRGSTTSPIRQVQE